MASGRNFFGVLRVEDTQESEADPIVRTLFHGRIVHGAERMDPKRPREPISYYGRTSGIGVLMRRMAFPNRRIGVVGLGAGAVAAYGRRGDVVRFYENNPLSETYARAYFSYLPKCPCAVEVVPGDARISMDREAAQRYDVLVLDAFSGDAIPAHLLTTEAFQIYLKHLAPSGVLAVHISNWYIDLAPVLRGAARTFNLRAALISSDTDDARLYEAADWILMSREAKPLDWPEIRRAADPNFEKITPVVWTDEFHSLFGVLRWRR